MKLQNISEIKDARGDEYPSTTDGGVWALGKSKEGKYQYPDKQKAWMQEKWKEFAQKRTINDIQSIDIRVAKKGRPKGNSSYIIPAIAFVNKIKVPLELIIDYGDKLITISMQLDVVTEAIAGSKEIAQRIAKVIIKKIQGLIPDLFVDKENQPINWKYKIETRKADKNLSQLHGPEAQPEPETRAQVPPMGDGWHPAPQDNEEWEVKQTKPEWGDRDEPDTGGVEKQEKVNSLLSNMIDTLESNTSDEGEEEAPEAPQEPQKENPQEESIEDLLARVMQAPDPDPELEDMAQQLSDDEKSKLKDVLAIKDKLSNADDEDTKGLQNALDNEMDELEQLIDNSPKDPLFFDAIEAIIKDGKISTALLQRKLGVGYQRAGKIMDDFVTVGLLEKTKEKPYYKIADGKTMKDFQDISDAASRG